jgi:hypothetical protein
MIFLKETRLCWKEPDNIYRNVTKQGEMSVSDLFVVLVSGQTLIHCYFQGVFLIPLERVSRGVKKFELF